MANTQGYHYPDVGTDPEVFLMKRGNVVAAQEVLPKPLPAKRAKYDNVAVEFNMHAAECLQSVNNEIAKSINAFYKHLLKRNFPITDKTISLRPAEILTKAVLKKYTSVKQFGCDPSMLFDGTNLRVSRPQVDPEEVLYRSIGYHVHLGCDAPGGDPYYTSSRTLELQKLLHSTNGRVRIVQMCDLVAGLPAVLLERNDERVKWRRQILGYGRAGEFREQPHGFEYRSLGPWPVSSPMWAWWANGAVRDALQLVAIGADEKLLQRVSIVEVQDAINTNDMGKALVCWTKIKAALKELDLIGDNFTYHDRHPILCEQNLAKLEFIIVNGGLSFANNSNIMFSFSRWIQRQRGDTGRFTAYYTGFPKSTQKLIARKEKLWTPYKKAWKVSEDNITRHLV